MRTRINRALLRKTVVASGGSSLTLRSVSAGEDSITMPAGFTAGDLLVLIVHGGNPVVSGWTKTDLYTGSDAPKSSLYTKVAVGGETLSVGANRSGHCFAFQNGTGIDASGVGIAGFGTSALAPTVTSGGSNRVLISGYSTASNWTITVPGGQTTTTNINLSGVSQTARCGYETISVAGATGTRTATVAGMGYTMGVSVLVY